MEKKLLIRLEEALNAACLRRIRQPLEKIDPDLRRLIDSRLAAQDTGENTGSQMQELYRYVRELMVRRGYVKKSGLPDEAGFYYAAEISANTWSNLRNGRTTVSKEVLLKIALALEMDEQETRRLMRLGMKDFGTADPRDRVILALMSAGLYDRDTVRDVLDYYSRGRFANIYHDRGGVD